MLLSYLSDDFWGCWFTCHEAKATWQKTCHAAEPLVRKPVRLLSHLSEDLWGCWAKTARCVILLSQADKVEVLRLSRLRKQASFSVTEEGASGGSTRSGALAFIGFLAKLVLYGSVGEKWERYCYRFQVSCIKYFLFLFLFFMYEIRAASLKDTRRQLYVWSGGCKYSISQSWKP